MLDPAQQLFAFNADHTVPAEKVMGDKRIQVAFSIREGVNMQALHIAHQVKTNHLRSRSQPVTVGLNPIRAYAGINKCRDGAPHLRGVHYGCEFLDYPLIHQVPYPLPGVSPGEPDLTADFRETHPAVFD